jgi:hypothetical protein
LLHSPASKTNHKLVRTQFAPFWCWDKTWATLDSLDSPRPRLGGRHHLPPHSILCIAPPRPRPSGSLSRDSRSGVPKLSRNCPGLDSRDFGPSQLLAPIFDLCQWSHNLMKKGGACGRWPRPTWKRRIKGIRILRTSLDER